MNSPELNSVLVRNIGDLEAITTRLFILDTVVDDTINEMTNAWAVENDWSAQCDEDDWWLAPTGDGWYNPANEDESGAYFTWGDFEDVNEDNYMVTQLCQKGHDKVGIRFVQDLITRSQWKKIVGELSDLIAGTGFVLEESKKSFFLPIKIDSEVLTAGITDDDIEAGLNQYKDVLNQLLHVKSVFDKIIASLKEIAAGKE
ncbi:hypothetical protein [Acetobacter thailandicus]|uniref:Uncharacterized protein n=1 Tax=Acetobacter thailandicus TaxID=1502842 RepID=A0ABT3QCH4_9PROT|nr:hypothetical protein [Acetobacter thailandicus]MCX2562992.1 hypothetical protein [Acetobacter thailandicus]NHN96226.1 hypothetical protein [Acetobacter thailandicus]